MSGEFPDPLASARTHAPAEVQKLFAPPPRDGRTVTAQSMRKRIPLWVVAAASGAIGLIVFAVALLLVVRPGSTPAPKGSGSAASAPNAPPGPFSAARTGFHAAIGKDTPTTTAPTHSPAPPSTSSPSPGGATSTVTPDSLPSSKLPAPTATMTATTTAPTTSASAKEPVAYGTLSVICRPTACENVLDNGMSLGPSPVLNRKVQVGPRRVTLIWDNKTQKVISTIVVADKDSRVVENRP
jgi:hypothetical protein